jgi:hypothetical protein
LIAISFGQRISQEISGGEDVWMLGARIFPENREQPNPIIQLPQPATDARFVRPRGYLSRFARFQLQ